MSTALYLDGSDPLRMGVHPEAGRIAQKRAKKRQSAKTSKNMTAITHNIKIFAQTPRNAVHSLLWEKILQNNLV